MKKNKARADDLVVKAGLAPNKSRAQALIMAAEILYLKQDTWEVVTKAGHAMDVATEFKLKHEGPQDVGRGAQKLRGAFDRWPELNECAEAGIFLDVGSSTGGFTQVLLEKGAQRVVALDVGTHQLHEKLRADKRVLSLEQTHILKVASEDWEPHGIILPFDGAVMDVSFTSVCPILPHVAPWLKKGAPWIVLVKPQFELDPKRVRKGIVRSDEDRKLALDKVRQTVSHSGDFEWVDVIDSPIRGGEGNLEFLLFLRKL